jgi:hypothetical protein
MASDLYLVIANPTLGAVVLERWIGGNGVRDRTRDVLRRSPDFASDGKPFSWAVSPGEALAIVDAHYGGGATPADVRRWISEYSAAVHWWTIIECH